MPRARFNFVFLIACGLAGLPASAEAQEPRGVPRVLIDRQFQERKVQLAGLDERTLQYLDAAGLIRREPLGEYLAVLPAPAAEPGSSAGKSGGEAAAAGSPGAAAMVERPISASVLELTDGQRFAGSLVSAEVGAAADETVRWAHPVLGILEFKLDQIRRIRLREPSPGAPPEGEPKEDDTLLLANGDRLQGFIESLGASVKFNVGSKTEAQAADVPLERIQEIVLANPAQEAPARAVMAYFRDGSIIACRALKTGRLGELTITRSESEGAEPRRSEGAAPAADGGAASLKLDDLAAVALDAPSLMPLSRITPSKQEPTGGRRWTRPVRAVDPERAMLGAADIEVPGPMLVEWELPAGATRLLTEAELPRQDWTWGDCELVVSVVGGKAEKAGADGAERELFRQRLTADQPRATVSVVLGEAAAAAGSRLRMRIEPGPAGPIQDRIVLHRPLLLIGRKPG